jgi:hypothetical protein
MYALIALLLLVVVFALAIATRRSVPRDTTTDTITDAKDVIITASGQFLSTDDFVVLDDLREATTFLREYIGPKLFDNTFYLRSDGLYLTITRDDDVVPGKVKSLTFTRRQTQETRWRQNGNRIEHVATGFQLARGKDINENVSDNALYAADKESIDDRAVSALGKGVVYHVSSQSPKKYFNLDYSNGPNLGDITKAAKFVEVPNKDNFTFLATVDNNTTKYLYTEPGADRYRLSSNSQNALKPFQYVQPQPVLFDMENDRGTLVAPKKSNDGSIVPNTISSTGPIDIVNVLYNERISASKVIMP